MQRIGEVFALILWLLVLWLGGAAAQNSAFVCRLDGGVTVPIKSDANLNNVAVARISAQGGRSIVFNPKYLAVFQVPTRWFWLAHECAHQQLGQVGSHYAPKTEAEADCYGIQRLLVDGQLSAQDVSTVAQDISKLGSSSALYPKGPERAANIVACARRALARGAADEKVWDEH